MQEFDDRCQQAQLLTLKSQRIAAEQDQQRTQALAAGRGDVIPDLFHQRYAGRQLVADDAVNSGEIFSHYLVKGLGLHRGRVLLGDCAACYGAGQAVSRQGPAAIAQAQVDAYNRGP